MGWIIGLSILVGDTITNRNVRGGNLQPLGSAKNRFSNAFSQVEI